MKEVIIVITILSIILGGAIWAKKQISYGNEKLISKLEELKKDMKTKEGENIWEKTKRKSEEIYREWGDISKTWSVIVLHEELDLIENSLIRMNSNVEMKEFKRAEEELDISIFLLDHILEKEKLSIKNIL